MADAAEAAAAAAAAVTNEIAHVEANAEAAIAAAAAATVAAEELAEDLAEAAMESERGQRIAALEQRFDTWQLEQSERLNAMQSDLQRLTELTVQPQAAVVVTPPSEPATALSISPPSETAPAEAVIIPASVSEESIPPAEAPARQPKRRFL